LASLREIQTARRKSLDAARQKLEGMLEARRKLEVDVENLEAQFKVVEVAQTLSEHNIDDSQLGRVKDLIADVRARLNVAERMANTQVNFDGEIPVSTPQSNENIVDQVTEYFNAETATPQVAGTESKPTH
jgi:phage shock protein A